MKELLKTSKFWSYAGMTFTVIGTACTAMAAIISSKETDAKIIDAVHTTIEEGLKMFGEGIQIDKI